MQINTGMHLSSWLKISVICLGIISCRSATSVPSGVLPLDSMKKIMWHIAEAETYANQHIVRDSTKNLRNETNVLYQKVFALHKTNKEEFAESLKYYESHPEIHKILLDSLLTYATRAKDSALKMNYTLPEAKPMKAL